MCGCVLGVFTVYGCIPYLFRRDQMLPLCVSFTAVSKMFGKWRRAAADVGLCAAKMCRWWGRMLLLFFASSCRGKGNLAWRVCACDEAPLCQRNGVLGLSRQRSWVHPEWQVHGSCVVKRQIGMVKTYGFCLGSTGPMRAVHSSAMKWDFYLFEIIILKKLKLNMW